MRPSSLARAKARSMLAASNRGGCIELLALITSPSDTLDISNRPFILHIACVEHRLWLKQDHMRFFFSHRAVLNAFWHDEKLARLQDDLLIAQQKAQPALHHQKELILCLVLMPDKLPLDLDQFDIRVVQLARNPGIPMVLKKREFL